MRAKCLGSSSSGNCYILTFENEIRTQSIMVECGFSFKEIQQRMMMLNMGFNDIESCLITHGHKDHSKAMNEIITRCIPVFASKEVIGNKGYVLEIGTDACIARDIFVTPFGVEHDFPNSLGFIIHSKMSNETILFINDCKYVKADLSNFEFDYVFIECNYIDKIVRKLYSDALKTEDKGLKNRYFRLINSHMSLYGTLKTLRKLNLSKCKGIFLMHLSDGHANEYLMKKAVQNATKLPTFVCGKYGGIK